jgi:hypothetical protein
MPKGGYEIRKQGDGYYIAVHAPMDETSPLVRQAIGIETRHDRTPMSFANYWLPAIRTPDYKVSRELADILKTATYGSSHISTIVSRVINSTIGKLRFSKKEAQDFSKFIEAQRIARDPNDPQLVGKFSANQFERNACDRSEARTSAVR